MAPKQNPKSRRKNSAPKRVVHDDAEGKVKSAFPQDPTELAKYILNQPITNFFKIPAEPDSLFKTALKAKEEAAEGEDIIYKCTSCKEKTYRSSAGLHYHLMNSCPGIDLCLTCLICDKKMHDADKMIEHIQGKYSM